MEPDITILSDSNPTGEKKNPKKIQKRSLYLNISRSSDYQNILFIMVLKWGDLFIWFKNHLFISPTKLFEILFFLQDASRFIILMFFLAL